MGTPAAISDLITTADAAKLLDVSPRRVLAIIKDGRLSVAVRAGRVILLSRKEVARLAKTPRPEGWRKGKPRPPKDDAKL